MNLQETYNDILKNRLKYEILRIRIGKYKTIQDANLHAKEIMQQVNEIYEFWEKQKEEVSKLQEEKFDNNDVTYDDDNNVIFDEGTLIHCAHLCNYEKLLSIKNKGILSGDFIGIRGEEETFYCADFYRADKKMKATELFDRIYDSDGNIGRGPFVKNENKISMKHGGKLAFIINPNNKIKPLLNTDMYLEENREHEMQNILCLLTNYKNEQLGQVSAIPYGMPSSCISGIAVGSALLQNKEYMNMLNELFPNCYIISNQGKIFYDPNLTQEQNNEKQNEILEEVKKIPIKKDSAEYINKRLANMLPPNKKVFSESEIGKSTINVPLKDKEKAQNQERIYEQEMLEEKSQGNEYKDGK